MGRLAELYDRMVVTARSPDRTVSITVTGRGALTVELGDDVRRVHTDESLERQLNAVVRVAIVAFQRAQRQAYEKSLDPVETA